MQRIKKRAVLLAVCAALAILTGVFAFYQLRPKNELPPTDWMLTFSVGMILQDEGENGVPVIAVMNGSIAEKAGICPGDCICALNNTEVRTREALDKEIGEVPETEGISLTVLRGDRTLAIVLR